MIVGISMSHNATACVVDPESGEVLFCCSEERFSRRKNDWGLPKRVLGYIFEHVVSADAVSKVVIGESCRGRWGSKAFVRLLYLSDFASKDRAVRSKVALPLIAAWELIWRALAPKEDYSPLVVDGLKAMGLRCEIEFFDHHTSHAASAYYCSPFDEALVFTLDGEGDRLSGSCWSGDGSRLIHHTDVPEAASAGKFYRAVTSLLGFTVNRHEGKVTGLAAYGDPDRFYPVFRDLLRVEEDGGNQGPKLVSEIAAAYLGSFSFRRVNVVQLARYFFDMLRAASWEGLLNDMLRRYFRETYGNVLGLDFRNLSFADKADVSAAAQKVLEEAVVDLVGRYLEIHPSKNLALAGGVFANVKLNQRLLENLPIENVYIHPGMGDEGLALGAAMLAIHRGAGRKSRGAMLSHVYLGPEHDDADVSTALRNASVAWQEMDNEELFEAVAQALVEEKIVGLFRGRPEYGPRALGHRTILVNPAKREINDILNARLRRSEFMPFAPVVLEDAVSDIFDSAKLDGARIASRFMTITLDVKEAYRERIQGVVHVDGTARPQIIDDDSDPVYLGIVKRFQEKTGIGCVVNTSFNVHEEPIITTPEQAVRAYKDDYIDVLVIENCVVGLT
ncbi:MAG: carbamoyltransferase C-terminal domain-containing protein [Candidatus Hydrogenedentes bacterium]|nr:carbamoyltransferase C-terminal domain-containing protein [Candidatus Hydrogenedentota bacterium]